MKKTKDTEIRKDLRAKKMRRRELKLEKMEYRRIERRNKYTIVHAFSF